MKIRKTESWSGSRDVISSQRIHLFQKSYITHDSKKFTALMNYNWALAEFWSILWINEKNLFWPNCKNIAVLGVKWVQKSYGHLFCHQMLYRKKQIVHVFVFLNCSCLVFMLESLRRPICIPVMMTSTKY